MRLDIIRSLHRLARQRASGASGASEAEFSPFSPIPRSPFRTPNSEFKKLRPTAQLIDENAKIFF